MSNPSISLIIPCYNVAAKIGRCLDSIFKQSFKDFEVIIINDGSADDLEAALAPYRDKIKYFRQENKGAPAARNFGFGQSRGEYVFLCDADVIMRPDMLEKMHQALIDNPQAAYAYSSFRFGWKKFRLWPFDAERLKKMPYICMNSLIRRECFPGMDESLKKFQDWDLWLTIWEKYGRGGVWIDEVLFKAITGGTMSSWLPSFAYRLPFFKSRPKDKYIAAEQIIKNKHKLL